MLGRSSISTCKTSLGRVVAPRVLSYSTEASSNAAPSPPPKPKRAIPRTTAFDDLVIPKLPPRIQGKINRSGDPIGLDALGHDEFDGLGRFSKILARRQVQDRPQPKAEAPQERPAKPAVESADVKRPRQQIHQQGRPTNTSSREGQRQGGRGYGRQNEQGGQGRGRAENQRTNQPRDRQPRHAQRQARSEEPTPTSEIKAETQPSKEILPDTATTAIGTTDLEALFAAPMNPATRVVPLQAKSSTDISSLHTQILLERGAGDYSRYLPENLVSTEAPTLKALGPVGYAQLTLARRQDAGLNQRKGVINLVNGMIGVAKPVTGGVSPNP